MAKRLILTVADESGRVLSRREFFVDDGHNDLIVFQSKDSTQFLGRRVAVLDVSGAIPKKVE